LLKRYQGGGLPWRKKPSPRSHPRERSVSCDRLSVEGFYLTPCVPLSFKGEGEKKKRGAKQPLLNTRLSWKCPLLKAKGAKI
jgi:hypothetical protein